jgi:hypothetical protein
MRNLTKQGLLKKITPELADTPEVPLRFSPVHCKYWSAIPVTVCLSRQLVPWYGTVL